MIRTLIIDDEQPARKRISDLLEEYPQFSVVGECKNGLEALEMIQKKKPDLIFLDIQMPGLNGLQVLNNSNYIPIIIFTTAYDEFALDAFEIEALDYLLKPFENERFEKALIRVKDKIEQLESMQLKQMLAHFFNKEEAEYLKYIKIKHKNRWLKLYVEDIFYIKSEGNYLLLHTSKQIYWYRGTLQDIEAGLNPRQFIRIHRSLLLNFNFVISTSYKGETMEYYFKLENSVMVSSSRSYKDKIDQFLQKNS